MAEFQTDDFINPLFPKGPSIFLRACLLILASLILMYMDQRMDKMDTPKSVLNTVVEPVYWVNEGITALINLRDHLKTRAALVEELEALKQQQLLLQSRLQKYTTIEAENNRIRALLNASSKLNVQVLIAEILSASSDPYRHKIRLSKGNLDGVKTGQALIDAYGIMGQVTEVYPMSSVAMLITDANHGIPVEITRNDLRTVVEGDGTPDRLRVPYLPGNADIRVGDILTSSGLGGRYPAGYPVAEVIEINHQPGEQFLDVYAKPIAQLRRGREVLLVWHNSMRLNKSANSRQSEPPVP